MPNQQNHTQSPVHQHPRPPSGRPKMGNRRSQCRPSTHLLPTTMLPPQLRFKHCKPDAVRIVGFDWDPATETISPSTDPRAVQKMQIIEFKYCTDLNHATVHALIREKYQHMESALRQQGWQCPIEIIPVTLSRSGTIHKHTLEAIHSLTVLRPKKQPPDKPPPPPTAAAIRLCRKLQRHSIGWLHTLLRISRQSLKPAMSNLSTSHTPRTHTHR
mmetsp:Transcript_39581/g.100395  ORF Transcript_39581/g.100395 Transcript_39581/m.100395 type:complete len:215 (-) Transcript_39581:134-778(-)